MTSGGRVGPFIPTLTLPRQEEERTCHLSRRERSDTSRLAVGIIETLDESEVGVRAYPKELR